MSFKMQKYVYYLFVYPHLAVLGLAAPRLSLVAVSRGCSLGWLRGLLIAVASLAVAPRLQSAGSVVVVHGLSCPEAYGTFWDQGAKLCPLHCKADSQPLDYQEVP